MTKYFRNGPGHFGARHRLNRQGREVVQLLPPPLSSDIQGKDRSSKTEPNVKNRLVDSPDNQTS